VSYINFRRKGLQGLRKKNDGILKVSSKKTTCEAKEGGISKIFEEQWGKINIQVADIFNETRLKQEIKGRISAEYTQIYERETEGIQEGPRNRGFTRSDRPSFELERTGLRKRGGVVGT